MQMSRKKLAKQATRGNADTFTRHSSRMTMGRGMCFKVILIALSLILWSPAHTLAATHTVGDSQGWGFAVAYADWANKNNFAAGDTLVFNYQSGQHNVVPVNAAGYKSCKVSGGLSNVASTGNDKFTLKKGANYFICSIPSHCTAGMRIKIDAV